MNVSDFDFELPPERIAQRPLERREASRLMVLERESGRVQHRVFEDLVSLLEPDDLLVLNDTRVIPARLIGRKASGGRVELLLLERETQATAGEVWRCLLRASRDPKPGATLEFPGALTARVLGGDSGEWRVRLEAEKLEAAIDAAGRMPLPPYIKRDENAPAAVDDRERYQTVFARNPGAVAAPTAGLHFSSELLDRLDACGVRRAYLTLHVGLGTFQPLRVERVEQHRMHEERFELPEALAVAIQRTRERGGRVVAVGTTVVRVLEFRATAAGGVTPGPGRCGLFIYPGFRFRVVDALITNFHLPRSSLLMLVAALAGRERVLRAYDEAIARDYRFYSYGDAMLVRSE